MQVIILSWKYCCPTCGKALVLLQYLIARHLFLNNQIVIQANDNLLWEASKITKMCISKLSFFYDLGDGIFTRDISSDILWNINYCGHSTTWWKLKNSFSKRAKMKRAYLTCPLLHALSLFISFTKFIK